MNHIVAQNRLITSGELAQILSVDKRTIYTWVYRDACPLPIVRVHGRLRFRIKDVLEYIEEHAI